MESKETAITKTTSASTAQTPKEKYNDVRGLLDRLKGDMAMALPRHLTPERMVRVTLTSIRRTPKLLDCTRESLLGAVMECAQLGLEPDGVLGLAYLIPFENRKTGRLECQLIIGYKGMLTLARRSAEVQSVQARPVYEGDEFEYAFGLDEKCRHVPKEQEGAKLTHTYAIVRLKDGGYQLDVMTKGAVEKIRERSRAKERGPWSTDYDAMACKTVLRRALKLCPVSVEIQRAIALDELADAGVAQELAKDLVPTKQTDEGADLEIPEAPGATAKLDRLADAIEAKANGSAIPQTSEAASATHPEADDDDLLAGMADESPATPQVEEPIAPQTTAEKQPDEASSRKAVLAEITALTKTLGIPKADLKKMIGKSSDELSIPELLKVRDGLLEMRAE